MHQTLYNGAQQFGFTLTQNQLDAFTRYSQELVDWNQRVNLTSITDPADIVVKHFLDSLAVAAVLPRSAAGLTVIDVGAGAGFPGLPLKIALPGIRLTLLEATGKKAVFLQHVVNTLGLPNVAVVTARAEEAGRQPRLREQFDVVLARAVAVMPVLAELTLPLVKVGGLVIAAKGQDPTAEIKEAANALGVLGGRVKQILPVTVPGLEAARHLVVIKKIKPTPKQYPRRPGLPAQKPI
jgi:16S rRNA (guanine527-N7)-methyltransferase